MNATIQIDVPRSSIVPSNPAERVAWLDAHGAPPAKQICAVTAPIAVWSRVDCSVEDDGTVRLNGDVRAPSTGTWVRKVGDLLRERLATLSRDAGGKVPEALDVTAMLMEIAETHERLVRESKAREAAETEAEIASWLARPAGMLLTKDHEILQPNGPSWGRVWTRVPTDVDPRVRGRVENELIPLLRDRYLETSGENYPCGMLYEDEVANFHHKAWLAKQKEARIRYLSLVRSYVTEHVPEFARAAREGHDVERVASDHVIASVKKHLASAGLEVVETYGDDRAQELPRSLAYERLDAVRAAILDPIVAGNPLLERAEATIVRADVEPTSGSVWRTTIKVVLTFVDLGHAAIYVCAEECCKPEDGSGGDDD